MIRALLKSESVPSRDAAKTSPLRFLRQVSLLLPYLPVVWEWFFSFTFYQLACIPLIPLAAPSLLSPLHPHHPITVRTELCISAAGASSAPSASLVSGDCWHRLQCTPITLMNYLLALSLPKLGKAFLMLSCVTLEGWFSAVVLKDQKFNWDFLEADTRVYIIIEIYCIYFLTDPLAFHKLDKRNKGTK